MYETNYNGLRYCFYDDCLMLNDTVLRYELMENIRHRGGDSPAFVFEYSGKQFTLPYPPGEIAQILPYMKLAAEITPEPDPFETIPLEDVLSEPAIVNPGPVISDSIPESASVPMSGSYRSFASADPVPRKNNKKGCLMLAGIVLCLLVALFACIGGSGDTGDDSASSSAPASDELTPTEETTEAPTTEADPRDELSTEERNAYNSALTYLSTMGFSRSGLIKQLEYEKYPSDACEKAVSLVEELGEVDWNEECLESAKNYLSTMSFSKDQLIDQLKYEGFSEDQINAVIDEAYQ